MKIGIITFHFVHNQGAVLQCYALQKYLEEQGHDVKVIDYCPNYHTVRYNAVKNPFHYAGWFSKSKKNISSVKKAYVWCRSFARCIMWNIKGKDKENTKLFSAFVNKTLKCTRKYTSLKALQNNPPEMDAYISGSDQVWNPDLLDHEFDSAYFLDFGKKDFKRITYAVSMGKELSQEECSEIKKLCESIDAISLRERNQNVIDATERDVHICIDPTLLLNSDSYKEIESLEKETEPYIFVYGFENTEDVKQAVKMAVDKYNCRVINGSPHRIKLEDDNVKTVRSYTPDNFLSYIKNAKFVVTNSFHGTAFSIIYKKKFVTVPHTTRGRRMRELLGKLGLNSALWGNESFSFDNEINYEEVYEKLQVIRKGSMNYLNQALSGCRGEDIPHINEE